MQGRTGSMIFGAFLVAAGGLAFSPAAISQTVFSQEVFSQEVFSQEVFSQEGAPAKKSAGKNSGEDGQKDAPAAKGNVEPEFKSAKGKEAFTKAKELFDLEQYREAKTEFSKAKSEVKSTEDRGNVDSWIKACEGGSGLASYRKLAEKGSLRRAFLLAMDYGEQCRNTPIYPRFTEFTDELRPKAAEVLDAFDVVDNRFMKKFGKEFVGDPAQVFRGANSLRWTSLKGDKVSQLQIKSIPKKWGVEYHSVVFWVRVDGYPVEIKLMTRSPGEAAAGQEAPVMECNFTPQGKPGWQRAEVELSQFKKHGLATLANVEKFMFQIDSKSTFKIDIDDVLLTKKDPSEKKGAEPEAKDEKESKKKPKTATGKVKQTERKNG